ncbi:hypothetical protein A2U01_0107290, partial [Trifolium medium]|nr:hypothetical protein [Trifolium medium]
MGPLSDGGANRDVKCKTLAGRQRRRCASRV